MRNIARIGLVLSLLVVCLIGGGDMFTVPEAHAALGDKTAISDRSHLVELLASATAANGAPTGTAGIAATTLRRGASMPRDIRVAIKSTAGSGTMTVSLRLWQRLAGVGWVVSQTLNAGSAIAETGADAIGYSEVCSLIDGADRYYLEITAIAGTATAVTGYAVVSHM